MVKLRIWLQHTDTCFEAPMQFGRTGYRYLIGSTIGFSDGSLQCHRMFSFLSHFHFGTDFCGVYSVILVVLYPDEGSVNQI